MPIESRFYQNTHGLQAPGGPANGGFLITPHDTNLLTYFTRGISFASDGALAVVMMDGSDFIIPSGALQAGCIHPLRIKQVKATGTTATGIVGYY